MLQRLLGSTVARLVTAIFVLQILAVGAAMLLLHSQMLQIIAVDRARQIFDVRDDLVAAFYEDGRDGLVRYVNERRGSVADPLVFVAVAGNGETVLSHVARVPAVPTAETPVDTRLQSPGGDAVDGVALASELSDGTRLYVGMITTPDRRFDLAFAEAISLTVVLTIGLALVGALLIGYVISRRTHAIAETAQALAAGNFAARIGGGDHGDGFDHLRQQMNFMAERIDILVGELQQVAGGLAHDLRSPVARLRAAIETAQKAVGDDAEAQPAADALQLARADAEALEGMLGAALELARLEAGAVSDRRQMLDLGELATDLAELYEPLADQSGVALDCATVPVPVLADRELLSRSLANLIDNALKYGGNAIAITVRREGGEALLEVADNGAGIAAQDRERAIGRFTRLDNARTRPGAGLGLTMVAAVARLHGGRLELAGSAGAGSGGENGGLVARLHLPLG
jgi:signal transduction histidine kinase